jgi:hypothetical protein
LIGEEYRGEEMEAVEIGGSRWVTWREGGVFSERERGERGGYGDGCSVVLLNLAKQREQTGKNAMATGAEKVKSSSLNFGDFNLNRI